VHNQFIILQTYKTLNCSFDKQLRPSFTLSNSHRVDLSVISDSTYCLCDYLITLHASWGTVYCNRSCLWVCLCVGLLPR